MPLCAPLPRRNAFTLVELLVVMAIIAILAALIVPALSLAKERAIRVRCLGNVKQLDMAVLIYGEDNNDNLPWMGAGFWAWDIPYPVADQFVAAGAERDNLYCPAFPEQNNDYLWAALPYRVSGYALTFPNTASVDAANDNPKTVPQEIQLGPVTLPAPDPTTRAMLADACISQPGQNDPNQRGTYTYFHIKGAWADYHRTSHITSQIYPEGGNVGFMDGHGQWRNFWEMTPRTAPGSASPVFWW